MAAKSDTAVRGTAARADCGSRDGAAGRARRYAREREDACVGEAAFEGEAGARSTRAALGAWRLSGPGARFHFGTAVHVPPPPSDAPPQCAQPRLDATRRGRRGYFARRACAAVPVAGGPRMFLAPCRLGSGEKSGEGEKGASSAGAAGFVLYSRAAGAGPVPAATKAKRGDGMGAGTWQG